MPDGLRDAKSGPDAALSETDPVSRGQWESIAVMAVELLGADVPKTRLDGTVMLARLRLALAGDHAPTPALPPIPEF